MRNLIEGVRSHKNGRLAVLVMGLMCVAGAAFADTPPAVPVVDYGTAAGVIITSVGATVSLLFPYLAVLIALFAGISIFRRMIKSGAKG